VNIFSIAVDPAHMRDRYPGDGNTRSSYRCKNAEGCQFFRYEVASLDAVLPVGLSYFAFRRLSEKQKRKTKNSAIFATLR